MIYQFPVGRVMLDTNVLIDYFEKGELLPVFNVIAALFAEIDAGTRSAGISVVTIAELLSGMYRQNDDERAMKLRLELTTHPSIEVVSVNVEVADQAARLRAHHPAQLQSDHPAGKGLRTPDALVAASALVRRFDWILTGDKRMQNALNANDLIVERRVAWPEWLPIRRPEEIEEYRPERT